MLLDRLSKVKKKEEYCARQEEGTVKAGKIRKEDCKGRVSRYV